MSTLIEVNEHLTVSLLKEDKGIVLCQKVNNGEFVVWYKVSDNDFRNGFYTFDLNDAMTEYSKRVWFQF